MFRSIQQHGCETKLFNIIFWKTKEKMKPKTFLCGCVLTSIYVPTISNRTMFIITLPCFLSFFLSLFLSLSLSFYREIGISSCIHTNDAISRHVLIQAFICEISSSRRRHSIRAQKWGLSGECHNKPRRAAAYVSNSKLEKASKSRSLGNKAQWAHVMTRSWSSSSSSTTHPSCFYLSSCSHS